MDDVAKAAETSSVSGNYGTIFGYIWLTILQLRGKPPKKRAKNKHSVEEQGDDAQESVPEPRSSMKKGAPDDVERSLN